MNPDTRFLLAHPSHFLALGFGSGLAPRAPGTFGTLLAWLLYPALSAPLSEGVFLFLVLGTFVAGIVACERAGKALGVHDHGAIVWDEMVAFWLVLAFTPPTFLWQAWAFVLFRFFDIVKPPPIRWADSQLPGGFGVMADDLLAAGYALLVLAISVRVLAYF